MAFDQTTNSKINRFDRIDLAVKSGLEDPDVIAKITGYADSTVDQVLRLLRQFDGNAELAAEARRLADQKCRAKAKLNRLLEN